SLGFNGIGANSGMPVTLPAAPGASPLHCPAPGSTAARFPLLSSSCASGGPLASVPPCCVARVRADAERLSVHRLGNGAELGRGYHEGSPQLYLRHGEPGRRF